MSNPIPTPEELKKIADSTDNAYVVEAFKEAERIGKLMRDSKGKDPNITQIPLPKIVNPHVRCRIIRMLNEAGHRVGIFSAGPNEEEEMIVFGNVTSSELSRQDSR